jgi:hypothetical protein
MALAIDQEADRTASYFANFKIPKYIALYKAKTVP